MGIASNNWNTQVESIGAIMQSSPSLRKLYLIGALRTHRVRRVASYLRAEGFEIFDDWHAAHPDADDCWRDYEIERGRSYREALNGEYARTVYGLDRKHLDAADAVVLVAAPEKLGGFSAGAELGWVIGTGRPAYILLDGDPNRWEFMAKFATGVFETLEELVSVLRG